MDQIPSRLRIISRSDGRSVGRLVGSLELVWNWFRSSFNVVIN